MEQNGHAWVLGTTVRGQPYATSRLHVCRILATAPGPRSKDSLMREAKGTYSGNSEEEEFAK